jgi:hypothetical protein
MINPKRDSTTVTVVSPDHLEFKLNFVEYITLRAEIKRRKESGWSVWIDDGLFAISKNGLHEYSEKCFPNIDNELMYLAFGG